MMGTIRDKSHEKKKRFPITIERKIYILTQEYPSILYLWIHIIR